MHSKRARSGADHCPPLANAPRSTEIKWNDVNDLINPVPSAGAVGTTLVGIQNSSQQNGRVGRWIAPISIEGMGNIVLPPQGAGAAGSDVCRIMLVRDKQPNGATFTVADLLQQNGGVAAYLSFKELFNDERFDILYDKSFNVECTGGVVAATIEGNKILHFCVPLHGTRTLYSGTGGTVTDITTNNYALAVIS